MGQQRTTTSGRVAAGVRAALLTTHLRPRETLRAGWSIILFYFIPGPVAWLAAAFLSQTPRLSCAVLSAYRVSDEILGFPRLCDLSIGEKSG